MPNWSILRARGVDQWRCNPHAAREPRAPLRSRNALARARFLQRCAQGVASPSRAASAPRAAGTESAPLQRMARSDSTNSTTHPVRYAVVGLGHIAQAAVLPAFEHARSNSSLCALVSGDATKRRKLSRKYGVPAFAYDDFDTLLASGDVDAVYRGLNHSMHAGRAARARVHPLRVAYGGDGGQRLR
jgi:hypothetical protein